MARFSSIFYQFRTTMTWKKSGFTSSKCSAPSITSTPEDSVTVIWNLKTFWLTISTTCDSSILECRWDWITYKTKMFLTQEKVRTITWRLRSISKYPFKMALKVMFLRLDVYCLRCFFMRILGKIKMSPLAKMRCITNTFGMTDPICFGKPKSEEEISEDF